MILTKTCFVKAVWRPGCALLSSPAELVPSADTTLRGSIGHAPFSHLHRTCPHHRFSAACCKKIYPNLCTKAGLPFTNLQIRKTLKAGIISGVSPFVRDGFMCPFPSHADSCFYSLMTTTAWLQCLCHKWKGKQIWVPGWSSWSSLLFVWKSKIAQTSTHAQRRVQANINALPKDRKQTW